MCKNLFENDSDFRPHLPDVVQTLKQAFGDFFCYFCCFNPPFSVCSEPYGVNFDAFNVPASHVLTPRTQMSALAIHRQPRPSRQFLALFASLPLFVPCPPSESRNDEEFCSSRRLSPRHSRRTRDMHSFLSCTPTSQSHYIPSHLLVLASPLRRRFSAFSKNIQA